MANTYTSLHYHLIFSTKGRERFLKEAIEARVWSYLGGIAKEHKLHPKLIGGFDDHVHMLIGIPPVLSVSDAVKQIKGGSSSWIKETYSECRAFAWQDGYAAFTVSKSNVPQVEEYIRSQRDHHQSRSFMEEYKAFLEKHDVEYDERYVFD